MLMQSGMYVPSDRQALAYWSSCHYACCRITGNCALRDCAHRRDLQNAAAAADLLFSHLIPQSELTALEGSRPSGAPHRACRPSSPLWPARLWSPSCKASAAVRVSGPPAAGCCCCCCYRLLPVASLHPHRAAGWCASADTCASRLHKEPDPLPPASKLPSAGDLGAYNAAGMTTLRRFMHEESMRDADAWLSKLMVEDELLGESRCLATDMGSWGQAVPWIAGPGQPCASLRVLRAPPPWVAANVAVASAMMCCSLADHRGAHGVRKGRL